MSHPTFRRTDVADVRASADRIAIAALTAVLVGAFVACSTGATTSPSSPATPAPVSSSSVSASPGSTGHVVTLEGASGNAVSVEIIDASGLLVGAESGTPGDGASVAPYEVVVTNDDPTTVRLVWAGGPCDSVDSLAIDATARAFLLVEPECPGDAIAFDRVLVLHFATPVAADEIQAILQDGLDTAS